MRQQRPSMCGAWAAALDGSLHAMIGSRVIRLFIKAIILLLMFFLGVKFCFFFYSLKWMPHQSPHLLDRSLPAQTSTPHSRKFLNVSQSSIFPMCDLRQFTICIMSDWQILLPKISCKFFTRSLLALQIGNSTEKPSFVSSWQTPNHV